MMLRNLFYLGIGLSLVFGCTTEQKENISIQTLSINPHKATESIRMSEISSSVKCIPLVTNDDLLIGEINKIIYENDCIYISDRLALYKFSLDGNLIAKIQKKGSGPDEYAGISDFQIDSDDTAWILSRSSKRIHKYGWDNKLKESISLDGWVSNICLSKENLYLYIGNEADAQNQSRLKLLDLKTKTIKNEYLPINPKQAKYLHVSNAGRFSKDAKTTYFFEMFNDTVYALAENAITPAYYLDMDQLNIPSSFFDKEYNDIMDFFQSLFKNSYAYGTPLFLENKEKYIFTYYYNHTCFMGIVYKNESLTHNFTSILEDNLFDGYPISLEELNISSSDNKLIISLQPSEIIEYAKEHLSNEQVEKMIRKLNYVSEDQNPVVLIIEM